MRLLIDAGNSRMKWRLEQAGNPVIEGCSLVGEDDPLSGIRHYLGSVTRVAVSTVSHEAVRLRLLAYLEQNLSCPIRFYWAEAYRRGLRNSYGDPGAMGADRWHGMYAAWGELHNGVAVIDAGSAVTVDYVSSEGRHLGGYILPGLRMMLKSLRTDAARIAFTPKDAALTGPGQDTASCVNHGLSWLSLAMVERIERDIVRLGLSRVVVTGGDGARLLALGLQGDHRASLVLDGLGRIDNEDCLA